MLKLLVDTCVWLDLAKDSQQQSLLGVLEELVRRGEVSLILPRTILNEFSRNRKRIVEEGGRGLSSVLKRAKEAVARLGDGKDKRAALNSLNNVDHKISVLGDAAIESVRRIENLFRSSPIIEISDDIKLRAAQRAIERRAPFHRQHNAIDDAILIEMYADIVGEKSTAGFRFAFVTHNTKDFSHPDLDNRLPHPDIASYFSKIRSRYFTNLAEAIRRVQPALVSDLMLEQEWTEEPRRLTDIVDAMGELLDKIWYGRHRSLRCRIERGEIKLVEKETWPIRDHLRRPVQRDVWEQAKRAATKVEKKYGRKNLGPWDDFEWGMMNGKLSALRWILGDEWDNLDT